MFLTRSTCSCTWRLPFGQIVYPGRNIRNACSLVRCLGHTWICVAFCWRKWGGKGQWVATSDVQITHINTLRIHIGPMKGIFPVHIPILGPWGWDWNLQSYSIGRCLDFLGIDQNLQLSKWIQVITTSGHSWIMPESHYMIPLSAFLFAQDFHHGVWNQL